jgi:hypothetical protein
MRAAKGEEVVEVPYPLLSAFTSARKKSLPLDGALDHVLTLE